MNLFIGIVIVIALLLIAAAVWLFAAAGSEQRSREIRERLQDPQREEEKQAPAAMRQPLNVPILGALYRLLWRSGFEVTPGALIRWCVLAALLAAFLLIVLGPARGAVIIAVIALVFFIVLSRRAALRRQKLVDQLPGFLENVVRILTAGNTLEEAFSAAARENPEPARSVFESINRQVRLGAPLEDVLGEAGTIYRLRDLKVIGLAVSVNRRYGGSIRNVFRSLVQAIRQRGTAAKELRALTAETRFSALVLAFVSIGLFAYMYLRNPQYYARMLASTGGQTVLALSLALLVAGLVLIWRMTNLMGDADE